MKSLIKELIRISFVVGFSLLTYKSNGQEFSGGLEVGIPMNKQDKYGLGVGASLRYETPWGTQTSLIIDGGIISFSGKSNGTTSYSDWRDIPLQVGLKYYFDEPSIGFYAFAQPGIHFMTVEGISQQNFGIAPGIGYQFEKVDIGIRVQSILGSNNDAFNFLGLRAAYIFSDRDTVFHRRRR